MKKVLILDDEQDILELWINQFKRLDIVAEIHTAANGQDGLKLIDTVGNYDLIITDYKMPILNGLDFIKKVRAGIKSQKTPIFFFTGYMPELKEHINELENVLLFEKPVISEKIKTHIKMCLT